MRRTTATTALILGLLLLGCDSDGTGPTDVNGSTDARELVDFGDDADDATDLDDEGDAPDADAAEDPSDVDLDAAEEEPDGPPIVEDYEVIEDVLHGGDCSESAEVCEGLYQCLDGVCTLDPAGRLFVEQSYRIREPEEVSHVFDFIKTFAADVAFFMLEISEEGEPTRRPARYGTADRIVQPDTLEVVYRWQWDTVDRLILTPARGSTGLAGNAWESNIFQWNLEAHIVLEDLRVDEVIGFVGEQAQVYVEFDDDLRAGEGEFRGIITRREAESRFFDSSAFEPFRTIVCRVHPDLVPPGELWTLADILDCNAAPMDVDLNGDGILDGYATIVDFLVEPATLAPPED